MPVAPFPSIQTNTINISLSYPGANAQTVERQVTSKIVNGLSAINNIGQITANSQAGSASIDLTLNKSGSNSILQTEVQIMQAIASSNIPSVVPQPEVTVNKGQFALIGLVLTSSSRSAFDLQNFAQAVLVPKFRGLPGSEVQAGTSDPVIKINLNPVKMAEYNLNPIDVSQLIDLTYQSSPLGMLMIHNRGYILNSQSTFNTVHTFGGMVIGYQYAGSQRNIFFGKPIYLKDIARISLEPRNLGPKSVFTANGKPADMIAILTTTTANPFTTADTIDAYLKQLGATLPKDIVITKFYDMSALMKSSLVEIVFTIIFSSALALAVAFVFLGRVRATIIPIVTIPVCLLSAMIFVYVFGFSINLITLLALVIAVGLVVDDAIVVMENISCYLERGFTLQEAVNKGTVSIAVAIIGITLTLVVVYIPIAFSGGALASLFKPFALTLAAAVFVSGVIALTLTPAMATIFLSDAPPTSYQYKFDRFLQRIIKNYHRSVKGVLAHPKVSVAMIALLIFIGGYCVLQLPQTVFPNDPNRFISINITGSAQDSVRSLEKRTQVFSSFYDSPLLTFHTIDIKTDANTGRLEAQLNLILKQKYLHRTYQIKNEIQSYISKNHLARTYVQAGNISNWDGGFDLSFYIYGGSNINMINRAAENITQKMKASKRFSFVVNQVHQPKDQLVFIIHQAKAAGLGISEQAILQLLSIYYGGYTLNNYFNVQGLSVPVVVQLNNQQLASPGSLQNLMIHSPLTNQYYPVADFASLKIVVKPLMISTFNGQPAVKVSANLASGYSLNQAINLIDNLMQKQPAVQYQYTGNALQYLEGNSETLITMLMGILCVYLLLTTLFRSFLDPLIILFTVPFSIIGGALSLYVIDGSLNLYSALGLITLIGLITKHGVLIVQFANNELQKGCTAMEAILLSTQHRFRPVIMTTLVMVFGALPLIFSKNVYFVARENLGITLIGGLLIGTLFSLYIVPLAYVLIKQLNGSRSLNVNMKLPEVIE